MRNDALGKKKVIEAIPKVDSTSGSEALSLPKADGALSRFEGFRRGHVAALSPDLFLLLFEHAQGMPSIEAELVLQDPRCGLPNSGFMPSDKERPSDMLDLLVRLIHLCPHTEALAAPSIAPESNPGINYRQGV